MEFVCPDPTATVRAVSVLATLEAFKLLPHIGERFMRKHKLPPEMLVPGGWVPVQRWLDAMKEIQSDVGSSVLRSVGASIVEKADFPTHFETVRAVLLAIDDIYYHNHRGRVGHYHVSEEGETIVVRCATPYPRHFEWGLIEGISRSPRLTRGAVFHVEYVPSDEEGDVTCTLRVKERPKRRQRLSGTQIPKA